MAQTLKFGNGTWATKKDSILAYNDENENYKPLPFNYTGAGKGTRVNKEGLIEVVENDRPRIDYLDSEDGVFLLEKAATNLVTYSEDFSQSAWVKGNSSIESDTLISPSGILNGSTLTDNTANTIHRLRYSVSLSASTNYGLSIFAKKGTLSNIQIALINTSNSSTASRVFDLENGALGESITSGSSGTLSDSKITNYGNGWYRCEITAQLNSTPNAYQITLATKSNGNATTVSQITYDGDGSGNVYLYGAMLEQSSQSSSYIPTQGSIQTRVAETANGSGNSEVFNSEQGVLFVEMSASDNNSRISLSDGSTSNRVSFKITDDNIDFQYRVGGNYSYRVDVDVNNYLNNKILMSYNNGLFVGYLNGFPISNKISGVSLADGVVNRLNLNDGDASDGFKGRIKEIGYYDEILTDLELETLTSYRNWESMVKELNLNIIHNE
jgi:hypothetical protein